MYIRLALVTTALFASASTLGAQPSRPEVTVVGTGGTIGSAGDYWGGNPTRVPIEQLVRIPGLDSVATVSTEQFLNVSSISIGPARWLELSRHLTELFRAKPSLAGLVVTHGTDTMEETAYFLDLTVGERRPVIVTGSMRPSNMAGADGPANLTNAVRAAVDPASRGRGTLVLMDDRLFAARDVTKTNSTRLETFQAPERGPAAIVDPDGIFYRDPSPARPADVFDISAVRELPRVDIVYSYAGVDSVAFDAVVAAGARGVVVAGVGRGGLSTSQTSAARRAISKGVVVVVSTRTGAGRVPVTMSDGLIGAGDLNAQKARVLLTLALTRTSDFALVRRIFSEHQ
jgi:L-asparaginase